MKRWLTLASCVVVTSQTRIMERTCQPLEAVLCSLLRRRSRGEHGAHDQVVRCLTSQYRCAPPVSAYVGLTARDHYRKMDHIERLHESKVKGLTRRLTQAENAYAEVNKKLNEMSEKAR